MSDTTFAADAQALRNRLTDGQWAGAVEAYRQGTVAFCRYTTLDLGLGGADFSTLAAMMVCLHTP